MKITETDVYAKKRAIYYLAGKKFTWPVDSSSTGPLGRWAKKFTALHTNLTEPKVDRLFLKNELRKVLVTVLWHSAMPPATVIT